MTANEFRQELKKLKGGYLFCGEEDYLKRRYLESARNAVVGEDDVFNHIRLNADTYSPDRLMTAIEALPVMAEVKFIEISGAALHERSESEIEDLAAVLAALPQYEYNVLILYAEAYEVELGTAKQPGKLYEKLASVLTPVVFRKETPARLAAWVAKHFAAEKVIAPPAAVDLLLSRCGCDMYTLSHEIEKLTCYVKARGDERLTEADVAAVSSEVKEVAAFDFSNALLDGSTDRAFSILNEMKRRKEKPEIILGEVSRMICDLLTMKVLTDSGLTVSAIAARLKKHEYRVGLYVKSASRRELSRLQYMVERCYEADLLIKASQLDRYAVLDRLVAEAAVR